MIGPDGKEYDYTYQIDDGPVRYHRVKIWITLLIVAFLVGVGVHAYFYQTYSFGLGVIAGSISALIYALNEGPSGAAKLSPGEREHF